MLFIGPLTSQILPEEPVHIIDPRQILSATDISSQFSSRESYFVSPNLHSKLPSWAVWSSWSHVHLQTPFLLLLAARLKTGCPGVMISDSF